MPVDSDGNIADIIMDPLSPVNRMNPGGTVEEQYLGAAARDVSKGVRRMLGCDIMPSYKALRYLEQLSPETIDNAYQYMLGFFNITCQEQFLFYRDEVLGRERLEYLSEVIENGIYLYYPTNNQKELHHVIGMIQQHYPPTYGPVSYIGDSGKRVTTKRPVRIGPLYFMLLEKIADDWASVSSARANHFGILSPVNRGEKHRFPWRNSPVKTIGETEGRGYTAYLGREAIAEMMDRSGNPITRKAVYRAVTEALQPTNIDNCVDRTIYPLGGTKPLRLFYHIAMCSGYKPVYVPEDFLGVNECFPHNP